MKFDVYLASGWFTPLQKEKMESVLFALRESGFSVFAPYESDFNQKENQKLDRDAAKAIYKDDIYGITNSKMVLAIYDECDSGTMMEVGYTIAIKKDIVMINSEEFMNLMLSVPINGLFHNFEDALKAIKSSKDVKEIINFSEEWKKDNF